MEPYVLDIASLSSPWLWSDLIRNVYRLWMFTSIENERVYTPLRLPSRNQTGKDEHLQLGQVQNNWCIRLQIRALMGNDYIKFATEPKKYRK